MTILKPKFQVKPTTNFDQQVYLAQNGQVVIEAENTNLQGDWQKVTVDGKQSVLWDAQRSSYNKVLSGQTLSYVFETDEAGQYSIAMNSARRKSAMNAGEKTRSDTGNDVYVAIIEEQTGKVVQSPTKLFTGLGNSNEDLRWGSTFDWHHKKLPAQVSLNKNTQYRLEVSGRSDGYVLDRITLSNDGFLKNTTIAESERKGNSPSPIPPTPIPNNSITMEAESMKLSGAYHQEQNQVASGGKVISLRGGQNNDIGTASFNFAGGTGHYQVIIDAFDENDGIGQIAFEQNGQQLASFTLDQQLGSPLANKKTMTSLEIADVFISSGDEFTIQGIEQGNNWTAEHTRIDSVEFIPIINS